MHCRLLQRFLEVSSHAGPLTTVVAACGNANQDRNEGVLRPRIFAFWGLAVLKPSTLFTDSAPNLFSSENRPCFAAKHRNSEVRMPKY